MNWMSQRLAVSWLLSLPLLLASLPGCGPRAPHEETKAPPAPVDPAATGVARSEAQQPVTVEIDFGNGRTAQSTTPWKKGMTALDVLLAANADGQLKIEHRGQGATAFIEAIDGVRNGTDKSQRNWLVQINGQLSRQSAGVVAVQPGDRVLWQYAAWE